MEQNDFIRTVFNKYFKVKTIKLLDAKTNELKIFYYGQLTAILELMPKVCVKQYKDLEPYFIGDCLNKIDKFINYVFSQKNMIKPECYDFIMGLLNED